MSEPIEQREASMVFACLESLRNVAGLLNQESPKLGQIGDRFNRGSIHEGMVMIETAAFEDTDGGRVPPRFYGPFEHEDGAHNYLNVKRDTHRERMKRHWDSGGSFASSDGNDKFILSHPNLRYRVIPLERYLLGIMAQVFMNVNGTLALNFALGEEVYVTPTETYGIRDEDEEAEAED